MIPFHINTVVQINVANQGGPPVGDSVWRLQSPSIGRHLWPSAWGKDVHLKNLYIETTQPLDVKYVDPWIVGKKERWEYNDGLGEEGEWTMTVKRRGSKRWTRGIAFEPLDGGWDDIKHWMTEMRNYEGKRRVEWVWRGWRLGVKMDDKDGWSWDVGWEMRILVAVRSGKERNWRGKDGRGCFDVCSKRARKVKIRGGCLQGEWQARFPISM